MDDEFLRQKELSDPARTVATAVSLSDALAVVMDRELTRSTHGRTACTREARLVTP